MLKFLYLYPAMGATSMFTPPKALMFISPPVKNCAEVRWLQKNNINESVADTRINLFLIVFIVLKFGETVSKINTIFETKSGYLSTSSFNHRMIINYFFYAAFVHVEKNV